MKTGIEVLDSLLGTARSSPPSPNQTQAFLIRGAPGSGKTTLSLQILDEHLHRFVKNDPLCPLRGVLISLETDPKLAWTSITARLDPQRKALRATWTNEDNTGALRLFGRRDLEQALDSPGEDVVKALERFLRERVGPIHNGLVVIDSLNLLADIVQDRIRSGLQQVDIRAVMFQIWMALEKCKQGHGDQDGSDLILIGEHHPGAPYDVSLLSESFACDTEILLSAEPIAGTPTIAANLLGPLGYAFERRQSKGDEEEGPQSIEIRSFCRVLKSRYSPNQSRRCAYDIVPGQGVVFSETYPGDGEVLLFHENAKQEAAWQDFLSRDLPLQFPALRYALFNRPAMQRTFATQRRYNQLHQKTDMHLACFDSYWVNWYAQLAQRGAIRDALRPWINPRKSTDTKPEEHFARLRARQLCALDDRIGRYLEAGQNAAAERDPCLDELLRLCDRNTWIDTSKATEQGLRASLADVLKRLEETREVGLLHPIPMEGLRLFGECCSPIISEMDAMRERPRPAAQKEKVREWERAQAVQVFLPRFRGDRARVLTVPFNANVSFLVRRDEILRPRLAALAEGKNRRRWDRALGTLLREEHAAMRSFGWSQQRRYRQRRRDRDSPEWDYLRTRKFRCGAVTAPRLVESQPSADTWEEVLLLCEGVGADAPELRQKYRLLIETQTFDSFLCAFLEFFWATGRDLTISPKYELTDPVETERSLFQALWLLREFFRRGIIDKYSTVEPQQFARRYPGKVAPVEPDWLFARHWYSTLVDVLSAEGDEKGIFVWDPEGVALAIQPLPYSAYSQRRGAPVEPVACWGEWHFAVMRGTENVALATELINNFMSSQRICERAARCAAVPMVEEFYRRYSDVPILRLYERGHSGVDLPKMTYGDLRRQIFTIARSRKSIFDYRHCMRELHPALTMVQHDRDTPVTDEKLANCVLETVDRIHRHQSQELMLH